MIVASCQGNWASLLITYVLAIVSANLRSALASLETFPGVMAKFLAIDNGVDISEVMDEIRGRCEDWQEAMNSTVPYVKNAAAESPWQHPMAQEILMSGLEDSWGDNTQALCAEVAENCFQLGQTQDDRRQLSKAQRC